MTSDDVKNFLKKQSWWNREAEHLVDEFAGDGGDMTRLFCAAMRGRHSFAAVLLGRSEHATLISTNPMAAVLYVARKVGLE